MGVSIRSLDEASAPAWDAFILAHPNGTFFHRAAWKIGDRKGVSTSHLYVFTERDGAHHWCPVSVGSGADAALQEYADTGAALCFAAGPPANDLESAAALSAHASKLLEQTGAARPNSPSRKCRQRLGKSVRDPVCDVSKTNRSRSRQNMKAIPRKQRAMVRKGIQNNLHSIADRNANLLHGIYAESVRNLGTPVFSRRYFNLLTEIFRDD